MQDTHEKTRRKIHRACLINLNKKCHCNIDNNSTRTAIGCRHDMTTIHDNIRTANRLHINQENVGSSDGLSGRCGVDSGPGVALRRTIAAPALFNECLQSPIVY